MRFANIFILLLLCAVSAKTQVIVVHGETVHTMAGPALRPGVVVLEGGKIRAVGDPKSVPIPDGAQVIRAAVVMPGLIDAHSTVGLTGHLNQEHDQEQVEKSTAIQPELRAVDAYNGEDRLVEWVRDFGITTLHTGHGPLALISGQTMIVKTSGRDLEKAVLRPTAMVAATLGAGARRDGGASPGTRAKAVALLREELIKAQAYAAKSKHADESKRPERNLRLEALTQVLNRDVPLMITAHRHHDILAALRLAKEFGFRLVLDGGAEAPSVLEAIRAAGVPLITHPTMVRSGGDLENVSMTTIRVIQEAGIPTAFQSGFEAYVPKTRVVLLEASVAVSQGLPRESALRLLTLDAARLLGVQDRIGSLEPGKDADLALYDGDPLEYTTHCVGTFINGVHFPKGR